MQQRNSACVIIPSISNVMEHCIPFIPCQTIARHCPQLRTIGLWGCENITGKAVSALISNCCHLTSLDVSMTKVSIFSF